MIEVMSLKYGPVFKRVFSRPEIFTSFTSAVLGFPINIARVETEYEYPKPVGFVKSRYDLFAEDTTQRIIIEIQQVKEPDFFDRFLYYHLISLVEQVKGFKAYSFDRAVYTIVVLTSIPKDQSIDYSYAHSDSNLINERNEILPIYPHRLIFLAPRLVNENTPSAIRPWLEFIRDSLDGKMDETCYATDPFHSMLEQMHEFNLSPDELSKIKDDAAWDLAKAGFVAEGLIKGKAEGLIEGELKGEVKGQILVLKRLLTRRFGVLPEWAEKRINAANAAQLEIWAESIFESQDIENLFKI